MKRQLQTILAFLLVAFASSTIAADSAGDLLKSYQSAHNANSLERVESLVNFRTRDQSRRAAWLKEVGATFSFKIEKISLVPFKESAFMLPESELKQLPASMKPVNWLVVELAPDPADSGRTVTENYLVAVDSGKYFIVGP